MAGIQDFLGSKLSKPLFLSNDDAVGNSLNGIALPTQWTNKVSGQLNIYKKEYNLIACAYFLYRKSKNDSALIPLLTLPMEVYKEDDVYYTRQKEENAHINPALRHYLRQINPEAEDILEALKKTPLQIPMSFDQAYNFEVYFNSQFPQIHCQLVESYGKLHTNDEIQNFRKRKQSSITLFNAIGLSIFPTSTNTREIISDLTIKMFLM